MIERRIYTVGQVSQYLKLYLESDPLLADVWVSGEMSNYRRYSSGHQYFTMKDSSGQLRCVLFRSSDMGVALEDGVSVVAHGRFSLYEARGDLQFYVDLVQPEGMGILHLEFLRLKAKLEEEGLFDSSRKRPIPEWPRRVGVITSPDGAVLHDIINIARRRYPLVELVVAPTQVQGDGAVDGITRAFRNMNSLDNIDLVILARGGGSLEELWPFNEETVARAIYGSRAPVISAVGHETDWTIADYVA
ncbi:MAG: exodeoxyribonuclease large subunit, partial [Dehalococcoidia bacterium]|nr:exodeoxyribonuclease large subunit [Dehalococcoidia bacterium]